MCVCVQQERERESAKSSVSESVLGNVGNETPANGILFACSSLPAFDVTFVR